MSLQNFEKYEALGNDFIIIDETSLIKNAQFKTEPTLSVKQRIKLCDRHLGIGGDGILTLFSTDLADLYMHITNADGSLASICGNGLRCAIIWLVNQAKIYNGYSGKILCNSGLIKFNYQNDICKVDMGEANFLNPIWQEIRLPKVKGIDTTKAMAAEVSIGNKHLVLELDVSDEGARNLGEKLTSNNRFNELVNVGFVKKIKENKILLSVFERKAGLTKACGSGACAAVAALAMAKKIPTDELISVKLLGGKLNVCASFAYQDIDTHNCPQIQMQGTAKKVFEGLIQL